MPPGPGKSLVRNSMVAATIVAILLAWWYYQRRPTNPGDERPPIIISDGSLDIFATPDQKSHNRGTWKSAGATWYHEHGGDDPARLTVNVLHGMPLSTGVGTSESCKDANFDFAVTQKAQIFYGPQDVPPLTLSIQPHGNGNAQKRHLTIDPGNALVDGPLFNRFWIRIGEDTEELRSVTFDPGTASAISCDLSDHRARLVIFQR